jgi:hypothetical protein
LFADLIASLDKETEETFTTEVEVLSYEKDEPLESRKIVKEIYSVGFKPHASWGLEVSLNTLALGTFVFILSSVGTLNK